MLRNLVLVLVGPALSPAGLPARLSAAVAICHDPATLIGHLTAGPATCVVVDLDALDGPALAAVIRAAAAAPVIAVGPDAAPRVAITLSPRAARRGELTRVLRYLLGETMRAGPRAAATGSVVVDGATLELVDVSDGGVRARDPGDVVRGETELAVAIDGGPAFHGRAREVRRECDGTTVFAFLPLHGGDRLAVRGWLLPQARPCPGRAADRRITRPWRATPAPRS